MKAAALRMEVLTIAAGAFVALNIVSEPAKQKYRHRGESNHISAYNNLGNVK